MEHAKFSASGSYRWTNCSASLSLEENIVSLDSSFSKEGVFAHDVAYKTVTNNLDEEDKIFITDEMLSSAKLYASYIDNLTTDKSENYFEKKVYFGDSINVDDSLAFGTADAIIYNAESKTLHVIDYKYGKGIKVDAKDNTQLILYAIGAYQELSKDKDKDINTITIHIVQPRINNFNFHSFSLEELVNVWIPFFKQKIEIIKTKPVFNPSYFVCKFCKAKPICSALKSKTIDLHSFISQNSKIESVKEDEIKDILLNSNLILDYLTSIKDYVYNKALESEIFAGHTIAKGKSVRKIKEELLPDLEKEIGMGLHKKTPLGVIEIEKILKTFNRDISDFVQIIEQKPVLIQVNN
jgi:hypothetical protein